jgi:hypothetical protein
MRTEHVVNKGLANERRVRPEDRVSIAVYAMAPSSGCYNITDIGNHANVQGIARWNGSEFKRCHRTGKTSGGSWDGQRFDVDLGAFKSCSLPNRLFKSVAKDRANVSQQERHKAQDTNELGQKIQRNSSGHTQSVYQPALAG